MSIKEIELIAHATSREGSSGPYTGPPIDSSVFKVPTSDDGVTSYRLDALNGLDVQGINTMLVRNNPTYAYQATSPDMLYATPQPREIVLLLGLRPNYKAGETPQSLRDGLYRKLSASPVGKLSLKLNMHDGLESRIVPVTVKSIEANISVAVNQMQVTLSTDTGILLGTGAPTPGEIELGSGGRLCSIHDDISTAPHGFSMTLLMPASTARLDIINTVTGHRFLLNANGPMIVKQWLAGDMVHINSAAGKRSVTLTRTGAPDVELTAGIMPYSTWPVVHPGIPTSFDSSIAGVTVVAGSAVYQHAYLGV